MTKLLQQLEEDRQLRNSARSLLLNELEYAKREYAPSAIGQRFAAKVGGKISEAGEQTGEFARRNGPKAAIAAVTAAGALGLWMMRKPILSALAEQAERIKRTLQEGDDEANNEDAGR